MSADASGDASAVVLGRINNRDFYFAQKLTLIRRYAKDKTDDLWCDHLDSILSISPEQRHTILEWGNERSKLFMKSAPRGLRKSFCAFSRTC